MSKPYREHLIHVPDLRVKVGEMNRLRVVMKVDFGVYLDGKSYGDILMPRKFVPEGCEVDDKVDVFVYLDSEDRLVATTETPYAMVGELACLKVVSTTPVGAFLDWGLPKDLLVPFREQKETLVEGRYYIVHVYFDTRSDRLVATTKVSKFLGAEGHPLREGDAVDLIIGNRFKLGYNVIIDKKVLGVIYLTEIFQPLEEGQSIKGYIKLIRPDGKIDVQLQKPGDGDRKDLSERILERLKSEGGFLSVTDKSPPETIQDLFQCSKKAYKRAVGNLYKQRLLTIGEDGIRLN